MAKCSASSISTVHRLAGSMRRIGKASRHSQPHMSRPPPGMTEHHLAQDAPSLAAAMSGDLASPTILIGSWSVRRKVIDYRGGGTSAFIGNAIITEHAFEEHGQFEVASTRLDSRRQYRLN